MEWRRFVTYLWNDHHRIPNLWWPRLYCR